jgi:hypothetical protein
MNEPDETFERFVRRFARIEVEVKDPPPFGVGRRRGAALGRRPGRRSFLLAGVVLATIVVITALAPLIGSLPSVVPTSSDPALVGGSNAPARSSIPSPWPTSTTVMVGEWQASCGAVEPAVCQAVAALAINNLARNRPTGVLTVESRPACPQVPEWADGSRCWQVYTPVSTGTVCMVVAKRSTDHQYAQVAGDVPGRASLPGDTQGCPPEEALVPLDPASPPVVPPGPCVTVVAIYDRMRTTIERDAGNATAVVIGTVTGVGQAQWNSPGGIRPNETSGHIGPSLAMRLLRVNVETVVRGSASPVLTIWIAGGEIGCHGYRGGVLGIERPEVGSRYAFFLRAAAPRTDLPGIDQAWQVWSISGDQVTTAFEGKVPLSTFIERASVQ